MIVPRADNANGARAKCMSPASVPVSAPLVRLYSDYMHSEYGTLDSDYVFVNLWSAPVGSPLRYQAVVKLVDRLRARTGIEFNVHMLRHSRATEMIRAGVAIEVVSKLLTHRSVTTTSDAYVHLDVEDLRAELVRAALLIAAIRPEFAGEIIRADPDDPVFGRGRCAVGGCARTSWARRSSGCRSPLRSGQE